MLIGGIGSNISCMDGFKYYDNVTMIGSRNVAICNVIGRYICNACPFIVNYMKNHNKHMKSVNGNIAHIKRLNIMQYNKGSSSYKTKEHIMKKHILDNRIDIACISEANLSQKYLQNNNVLSGYICETKPMAPNLDMSRNIILINDKIPYVRRFDLENQFIATIWLEIKLPSKKNLLIMGG